MLHKGPTAMRTDVAENHTALTEEQVRALQAQAARIVESEFFRSSHRCSRFLAYSVKKVIEGCPPEKIKERVIGAEVFQRLPGYDTAQDNIVRVTATDVRRRLAQYYSTAPTTENPVIDLFPGSYAVALHWRLAENGAAPGAEPAVAAQPPGPVETLPLNAEARLGNRVLWTLVAVAVAVVAVAFFVHRAGGNDVLRKFWSPLLDDQKPVLICIAQPKDTGSGPKAEHIPATESYVGVGDAHALAEISGFLSSRGKPWRLLAEFETPSEDLKSGPVVLIGAYSNPWTLKMTENLRYVFAPYPETAVMDTFQPDKKWRLTGVSPEGEATEDYAIVSRFLSPKTGEPVIVVAGLVNSGTQAAGEFIANRELLAAALRNAPKDWEGKNFQFVLHSKVIGSTPEHPTVVAAYFW